MSDKEATVVEQPTDFSLFKSKKFWVLLISIGLIAGMATGVYEYVVKGCSCPTQIDSPEWFFWEVYDQRVRVPVQVDESLEEPRLILTSLNTSFELPVDKGCYRSYVDNSTKERVYDFVHEFNFVMIENKTDLPNASYERFRCYE